MLNLRVLAMAGALGAAILMAAAPAAAQTSRPAGNEVVTLLGRTVGPPEMNADRKMEIDMAREALAAAPGDADKAIALGIALSNAQHYQEAVRVYTAAIEANPDHAMLYRHRGHRYISTRRFDEAVADLTRAAELRAGEFDIYYHLGLAHFLKGDYAEAEKAYRLCAATVEDVIPSYIAVSNWLYATLRRQKKDEEAKALLERITPEMDPGANALYHNSLLFFKGVKSEEEIVTALEESPRALTTTGFGVANFFLSNGETAKAVALMTKLTGTDDWPAFGFIAAEAELARRRDR